MNEADLRQSYDYWVKAFTEPSFEYIWAYFRVVCVLSVLAFIIWFIFGPEKKPNLKVGLDGEIDLRSGDISDDKKKKSEGGSTTRGDTRDTTKAETEGANEYRSMSLKRELDRKGPFEQTQDESMLKRDSFVKLSAIFQKHVWLKFNTTYRELLDNRYSLYQERRFKDYDKTISTQVTKFVQSSDSIAEKGIVFLQQPM